ncbi:hypothetical protein AB4048_23955 [Rhizobium sp. RAF56]
MPTELPDPVQKPRGPLHAPNRIKEEPSLPPSPDPRDNKNPNDPPLDPTLLPIGDPAGAA